MGAILGFLYNFLTMPIGLPINPLYSWLIMAVIGVMAFWIAYGAVGKLGLRGDAGSVAHWIIRFVVFVLLWGIVRIAIWAVQNWQLSLMAVGGIAAAVILSVIAITIMRRVKKRRTVNGNA